VCPGRRLSAAAATRRPVTGRSACRRTSSRQRIERCRPGRLPSGADSNADSLDRLSRGWSFTWTQITMSRRCNAVHYAHRRYGIRELGTRAHNTTRDDNIRERFFPSDRRSEERCHPKRPGDAQRHDVMVSAALYCDRLPLPPNYRTTLDAARTSGGYYYARTARARVAEREPLLGRCHIGLREQRARSVGAGARRAHRRISRIESEALLSLPGGDQLCIPDSPTGSERAASGRGFSATGQHPRHRNGILAGCAMGTPVVPSPTLCCVHVIDPQ